MAQERIKTQYPGVRYKEHESRKHNKNLDRYFSIRYKLDGKLKEEGLGWASEGWTIQKAANLRAELLENQRRGEPPFTLQEKRDLALRQRKEEEEAKKKNITFKEAADIFLRWGQLNKKDWVHDKSRLNHFRHLIDNLLLKDFSLAHIEQVKGYCQEQGLSPASVKHCITLIRTIFNHCSRLGLFVGMNPTKGIKMPQKDNKRVRFLSYEEAEDLLAALYKRSVDLHDQALLALHTGMRAGEIFALRWDHLDLENGILNIMAGRSGDSTKGGLSRQAYITDRVKAMLQRRKEQAENSLVFPSRTGGKHRDVSDTFARTVKDIGLNKDIQDGRQKVCFHTLRHTFASWLALQGETLLTIKELLGHKSIEMTMRYAHLVPDHKKAAVAKLGQRSSGKVVDMQEAKHKKVG